MSRKKHQVKKGWPTPGREHVKEPILPIAAAVARYGDRYDQGLFHWLAAAKAATHNVEPGAVMRAFGHPPCWVKANPCHPAEPVALADLSGATPEFGRTHDVRRLFGLRRGTLYNLLADGKIRGVTLRVRGQKSGVRLWALDSTREYIRTEMERLREGKHHG